MSEDSKENEEYRNKAVINQRGASISVNNSTDREGINISQYSGSNIGMDNYTNSELASNNKQTRTINDRFDTTHNDDSTFIGRDSWRRVVENNYDIKGTASESEVDALNALRDLNEGIAKKVSQFNIKRGGYSIPNGAETPSSGSRASNPTLNQQRKTVENKFSGYLKTPIRDHDTDEVVSYIPVPIRVGDPAQSRGVTPDKDIAVAAGTQGSSAPGVLEFGPEKSAATEGGNWDDNTDRTEVAQEILDQQEQRSAIEALVGKGGDDIEFVKRHKVQVVGAATNNFPSVRIDPKGRSQPVETLVGETGAFVNLDYIPHVEDVSTDSNYPCGDYSLVVGNKYNVLVGSGGINMRTSGPIELGGTTIKVGAQKINIAGAQGVQISSENSVEIQSLKSIQLRSNRQVSIEPSLGVKENIIIGGGAYIEGETYLHHVTAPVEIQETEDTTLYGQFNTLNDRSLVVAEALVGGQWWPVYALNDPDLIANYPHSHHFKNLPLRLTESNSDVRKLSMAESINTHGKKSVAMPQIHARKSVITTSS
jgi:hypothetical protein